MIVKLIGLWYLFVVCLTAIAPTNIDFNQYIYGSIFLIFAYLVFCMGFASVRPSGVRIGLHGLNLRRSRAVAVGVASILASVVVARFYTGKLPTEIISSFGTGASLYGEYQAWFVESNIRTFSLDKVPYILLAAMIKIALISFTIYLITFISTTSGRRSLAFFGLSLIVIGQLYFSIARGTSFEIFEISVLLCFSFVLKNRFEGRKHLISPVSLLVVFLIGVVSLVAFAFNIEQRNVLVSCNAAGICFDTTSWLAGYHEKTAIALYKLSSYFSFGLVFSSVFIEEIFVLDGLSLSTYIMPFGPILFGAENATDVLCGRKLNCGVSWMPDSVIISSSVGILVFLVGIYMLGKGARVLEIVCFKRPELFSILIYFIFMFMLSLPIGNFVTASSATSISLVFFMFLFFSKKLSGLFIRILGVKRVT